MSNGPLTAAGQLAADLADSLAVVEALTAARGSVLGAARALGVRPQRLHERLRSLTLPANATLADGSVLPGGTTLRAWLDAAFSYADRQPPRGRAVASEPAPR